MTRPRHTIVVDRIVLRGVSLTPGRAEDVRRLVAAELARLFGRAGALQGLASFETARYQGEPLPAGAAASERGLAGAVAQATVQAVTSAGSSASP